MSEWDSIVESFLLAQSAKDCSVFFALAAVPSGENTPSCWTFGDGHGLEDSARGGHYGLLEHPEGSGRRIMYRCALVRAGPCVCCVPCGVRAFTRAPARNLADCLWLCAGRHGPKESRQDSRIPGAGCASGPIISPGPVERAGQRSLDGTETIETDFAHDRCTVLSTVDS